MVVINHNLDKLSGYFTFLRHNAPQILIHALQTYSFVPVNDLYFALGGFLPSAFMFLHYMVCGYLTIRPIFGSSPIC